MLPARTFRSAETLSPRCLALSLAALAALELRPEARWLGAVLTAAAPRLPSCAPSQLAAIAASLAALDYRPDGAFLAALRSAATAQLRAAAVGRAAAKGTAKAAPLAAPPPPSGTALATLLAALADLECAPAPGDAPLIWAACGAAAAGGGLSGAHAAAALHAAARLGAPPPEPAILNLLLQAALRQDGGEAPGDGAAAAAAAATVLAALPRLLPPGAGVGAVAPAQLAQLLSTCAASLIGLTPSLLLGAAQGVAALLTADLAAATPPPPEPVPPAKRRGRPPRKAVADANGATAEPTAAADASVADRGGTTPAAADGREQLNAALARWRPSFLAITAARLLDFSPAQLAALPAAAGHLRPGPGWWAAVLAQLDTRAPALSGPTLVQLWCDLSAAAAAGAPAEASAAGEAGGDARPLCALVAARSPNLLAVTRSRLEGLGAAECAALAGSLSALRAPLQPGGVAGGGEPVTGWGR